MSARRSAFTHTSHVRSDELAHADDGRKDDTVLQNEQPLEKALDDAHGQDAAVGVVERYGTSPTTPTVAAGYRARLMSTYSQPARRGSIVSMTA